MIKLLLVEDDPNLCYIVQSGLQELIGGYDVCTAANGGTGSLGTAQTRHHYQ